MRTSARLLLMMTLLAAGIGCSEDGSVLPQATPTLTSTASATPTASTTATRTAIVVSTSTATASPEPTATSTASPRPTATVTPSGPVTEDLTIEGLPAGVEVLFDDLGFPHVYAPDIEAAIFTQGYLMAGDRFFEMDIFRRLPEGRLSEIFGTLSLETDVTWRTQMTTRDGRRIEEAMWEHIQQVDPEVAGIVRAFSNGVNAWLGDLRAGRNHARIPPEYTNGILLNETPMSLADWRPQDSLAVARLQAWGQSNSLGREIDRARIRAALPEPLFLDLYRAASPYSAISIPRGQSLKRMASPRSPIGPPPPAVPLAKLDEISVFLDRVRAGNPISRSFDNWGSNNWIVAPSMSANGHAMLANDPHLPLFNPPMWYVNHIVTEDGYSMNGVIFPGLFGVILGHNEHGAWGSTNGFFDVTDVYVEQVTTPLDYPQSPRTVLWNGQQVPVLRIEEPFRVRGRSNPVKQVIEVVPHHGPMVPDPNLKDAVVGIAATGMSFRWTGHEPTDDFRSLIDVMRARNVEQFRAALSSFAVGGQNWIWADIDGNIAYFAKVHIPQRPAGVVPYEPVDGTGGAEWLSDEQGHPLWLPDEKIPQATNPPAGYLATANNDQLGNTLDNDPLNDGAYLFYSAVQDGRLSRILEMLSNATGLDRAPGAKITFEDMSRYQYDHKSLEAGRFVPLLLAAAAARPDLLSGAMPEALERLRRWGVAKVGSPAYSCVSGVDVHDLRNDIPPRQTAVSEEEAADSIATSIYVRWSERLGGRVLEDDFAGTGIGVPYSIPGLLHIVEDIGRSDPGFIVHTKGENGESTLWDDKATSAVETRDEVLLASFREGLESLASRFGSADQRTWLWGKINQVAFRHLLQEGGGIPGFDLGPFATNGGPGTVDPGNGGGASQRFVALLDPAGIRAVNSFPGGENGNPGRPAGQPTNALYNRINPSIHYGDHIPGYLNGETFEYRIQRADVEAHLERRWNLAPR